MACGSHIHGSVAWQSCGGQQNEQGKMGPNFTSMHSYVKSWAGSCEWYVCSYAARKREEAGRLIFCRSGLGPWPKIPTKGLDTGSMLRCLWVWAWIYALNAGWISRINEWFNMLRPALSGCTNLWMDGRHTGGYSPNSVATLRGSYGRC